MPVALHKSQEMAAHWKSQIELCDKELRRFRKRGKKILEKYRDDRQTLTDGTDLTSSGSKRSMNLFWSNIQTLKQAIYGKMPSPICERRFLDKDTTGRVAATVLERGLRYEIQVSGFDTAVRRSRDDRLLPGRGQVWIRYNPRFGPAISPEQKAGDEIESPAEESAEEKREFTETEQAQTQVEAESL